MPDCHYGKGATVGTVLATQGAVIPAAVGVDIGCGMIAVRTPLKRVDIGARAAVRAGIERRIPMSAGKNNAKLTVTSAERVHILEALAKETRATPDQYDRNWRLALGTLGAAITSLNWPRTATVPSGSPCTRAHAAWATRLAATTSRWPNSCAHRRMCAFPTATSRIC